MSKIIQYDDDTVLLTYHRDLDNGKKLEYSIDTLLDYCTPLTLQLNADKAEKINRQKKQSQLREQKLKTNLNIREKL